MYFASCILYQITEIAESLSMSILLCLNSQPVFVHLINVSRTNTLEYTSIANYPIYVYVGT